MHHMHKPQHLPRGTGVLILPHCFQPALGRQMTQSKTSLSPMIPSRFVPRSLKHRSRVEPESSGKSSGKKPCEVIGPSLSRAVSLDRALFQLFLSASTRQPVGSSVSITKRQLGQTYHTTFHYTPEWFSLVHSLSWCDTLRSGSFTDLQQDAPRLKRCFP